MRTERSSSLASPHALFLLFYASPRSVRVALLAAPIAVAALNLAGCASVLSKTDRSEPEELQRKGLVYWLPKRDIKVTVTVGDGDVVTGVVAGPGDMEPDYSKQFVLDYQPNLIGTNALNVAVNEKGLLGSVVSVTTVKLSEVLREIAKGTGVARAAQSAESTCPKGTYERLIAAQHAGSDSLCGYTIEVKRLIPDPSTVGSSKDPDRLDAVFYPELGRSGIYYRQQFPYRVEITPTKVADPDRDRKETKQEKEKRLKKEREDRRDFLVFSPSESPVYFLPVRRTLFSNNKADLAFTEGVPTKYDQSTDGELIGLLKLPADVIGAYFGAIGQIFQYRQGAFESEQKYLDAQSKLMLEMVKFQACKEAINLGKKDADLKAACGTQQ